VLLLLGTPFLGIRFGSSDHRVLPTGTTSRTVQETITSEFSSIEAGAIEVVTPDRGAVDAAGLSRYAATLSTLKDVARVDAATGSFIAGQLVAPPNAASARFGAGATTWLSVVPKVEPISPAAESLVKAVRHTAAPFAVQVSGPSAAQLDGKTSIFSRAPLAGLLIAIVTFSVLFLMLGSIVVPLKALVLNVLSLSATFGAMVWIFQEGHLSGALGFTATGTIDLSMPILMFCIAFGLSMDYEVFLLSRIKEEHDLGRDTVGSVAIGLERTGRIVTAAAVLISVVFLAFATSGITFIKMFGIGLSLAVLMDAFLIRSTLVPAFMRLAGDANWWAPAPLRRFYARYGFSEHVDLDDDGSGEPIATVAPITEAVGGGVR
jgi:RND superfamily putative drug exporter